MENYHKYLSATESDKQWGLYLVTAGQATTGKGTRYPAEDHPGAYLFNWNKGRILNGLYIVYIAQGKGVFESEHTPASTIREGTCFMLFPNVWHRYQPDPGEGWQEYWLGFQGSLMRHWVEKNCLPDRDVFPEIGQNSHLVTRFQKILKYVQENPPGLQQIITGIAMEILGMILSAAKEVTPQTTEQKIEWARILMTERLETPIDMPDLAAELAMSYSLFRKCFRKITGISPGQYYLRQRLDKARELLATTLLPVEEVARLLGFESVFYFSRVFKNKTGHSPTAYRKKFFLS